KVTIPIRQPRLVNSFSNSTSFSSGPVWSIRASSLSKNVVLTSSSGRLIPRSLARAAAMLLILMVLFAFPPFSIILRAISRASWEVIVIWWLESVSSMIDIQSLQSPYSVLSESKGSPVGGWCFWFWFSFLIDLLLCLEYDLVLVLLLFIVCYMHFY